jgi:ABC-type branched-subunit amino acid transport system substrate-binding protein
MEVPLNKTLTRMFTASTLIGALALTGCAGGGSSKGGSGGNTTGVTDTSILIGGHTALTGLLAPGLAVLPAAWDAYFNYVNDHGGVYGRKIDLRYADDAYSATEAANVVRRLVQQDKVFAIFGGVGNGPHAAVLDFLSANGVPDLFPSGGALQFNDPEKHPNTFGFQTDYVVESKIQTEWALDNYPDAVYCAYGLEGDNTVQGLEGFKQASGGKKPTSVQTFTAGSTNISAQVAALQQSDCGVVFVYSATGPIAQLVNESSKVGFHPQFVANSSGSNAAALVKLMNDPKDLEGFAATNYLPPVSDKSNPWVAAFAKIWDQYGSQDEFQPFALYGLTQAYLLVAALQAAGPDLTREGLVEAMTETDFSQNPGTVPLVNTKDNHAGYIGGGVYQIKNGEYAPETTLYTTGHNADDPIEEIEPLNPPVPKDTIPNLTK